MYFLQETYFSFQDTQLKSEEEETDIKNKIN